MVRICLLRMDLVSNIYVTFRGYTVILCVDRYVMYVGT